MTRKHSSNPRLSLRERQIAFLRLRGFTIPEIASTLGLAPDGLYKRVSSIYRKYNIQPGRPAVMLEELRLRVTAL